IARQTLDDIARVNPQINAWTEVTAQRMLAEADSIEMAQSCGLELTPPAQRDVRQASSYGLGEQVKATPPLRNRKRPAPDASPLPTKIGRGKR
ncbi:glycerate kinase, partial [Klebsiella pneumoniae]|uniref:glycerate kinase n=1 Tax=Klebsiella pneumoniae TaxID=573 RepID=UPI00272E87F7